MGAERADSKTRSRTSGIYARLRDDIIVGAFAPGEKLKIIDLSARYELGATPIREALSMLAAHGLVEREDQRGFRVAIVSSGEFEELLRFRCSIEERALRLSIGRAGPEWEEAIVVARHHLNSTPRLRSDGEIDLNWERCHKNFHMSLLSGCGSSLLLRISHQLYDENNRYRFIARLSRSSRPDVQKDHERIADAALARDADRSVDLLIGHYETTGKLLHAKLRRDEEDLGFANDSGAAPGFGETAGPPGPAR